MFKTEFGSRRDELRIFRGNTKQGRIQKFQKERAKEIAGQREYTTLPYLSSCTKPKRKISPKNGWSKFSKTRQKGEAPVTSHLNPPLPIQATLQTCARVLCFGALGWFSLDWIATFLLTQTLFWLLHIGLSWANGHVQYTTRGMSVGLSRWFFSSQEIPKNTTNSIDTACFRLFNCLSVIQMLYWITYGQKGKFEICLRNAHWNCSQHSPITSFILHLTKDSNWTRAVQSIPNYYLVNDILLNFCNVSLLSLGSKNS